MPRGDKQRVLLIDHPGGKRDDRASMRLAELGFEVEWRCPGNGDPLPSRLDDFAAAVAYGGPQSVNDLEASPYLQDEINWIGRWVAAEKPFLGICLGGQMLARALDARVSRHDEGHHEIGYVEIAPTPKANGLFDGPLYVYHWHNEGFDVPEDGELLATGPDFPNQAFRYGDKAYGLQFHPEVTPKVMERWISEAPHSLAQPGAHQPERQRRDSEVYDQGMARWLDRFLETWPH